MIVRFILGLSVLLFSASGKNYEDKNETYLKFMFVEGGEANDASYEPCYCKNSIYNGYGLIVVKTTDIKAVQTFVNFVKSKKVSKNETLTFMNFSNAFIYNYNNVTDTIYTDSEFKYFTDTQPEADKILNLPNFRCYTINVDKVAILPPSFIKKYEKDRKRQ